MGVSLRIDNDDVPIEERLVIEKEYEEIRRLNDMHGAAYDNAGITNYRRLPIRNKGDSEFL